MKHSHSLSTACGCGISGAEGPHPHQRNAHMQTLKQHVNNTPKPTRAVIGLCQGLSRFDQSISQPRKRKARAINTSGSAPAIDWSTARGTSASVREADCNTNTWYLGSRRHPTNSFNSEVATRQQNRYRRSPSPCATCMQSYKIKQKREKRFKRPTMEGGPTSRRRSIRTRARSD